MVASIIGTRERFLVRVARYASDGSPVSVATRTIRRPGRTLAVKRLRQAPPPAEVGASPDRLRVGRGKPAEQLDVVGLVVEAGRGSS